MDQAIWDALRRDRTIDISTIGRQSGKVRRIEIWFHNIDDEIYISGSPGKRDWYANMLASPAFRFHLKGSVQADLQATAVPIIEAEERRKILGRIGWPDDLDELGKGSPLVRVEFNERAMFEGDPFRADFR